MSKAITKREKKSGNYGSIGENCARVYQNPTPIFLSYGSSENYANHIWVYSYNDIGLYASLGLGYITSSNFLFELSWQMKQAKIKGDVYVYYIKIATIDVDQTINTLMLTVGYRI